MEQDELDLGIPNEEEAHFYWTIREFEDVLLDTPTQRVIDALSFEAFSKLRDWFVESNKEKKDVGVLLGAC